MLTFVIVLYVDKNVGFVKNQKIFMLLNQNLYLNIFFCFYSESLLNLGNLPTIYTFSLRDATLFRAVYIIKSLHSIVFGIFSKDFF